MNIERSDYRKSRVPFNDGSGGRWAGSFERLLDDAHFLVIGDGITGSQSSPGVS